MKGQDHRDAFQIAAKTSRIQGRLDQPPTRETEKTNRHRAEQDRTEWRSSEASQRSTRADHLVPNLERSEERKSSDNQVDNAS